ncbi:energy-coupling factor transporter transmembrane protein EcfT [Microvirga sp. W0021]|uniref:Energy-coupling factor transporter transmembrane protein EcfT n=1 Tax=Hohaiivirga grylli TaxID=3133970 RepID=A0ABV0BI90_9HYPH
MIAGYLARDTFLHRISAGKKLLLLAGISVAFPFVHWIWFPGIVLSLVLVAYALCGREALKRLLAMRMLILFLVFIGLFQVYSTDWITGLNMVLRLLSMILLADLVTLSSTMQEMMNAIQPLLRPFARFGVSPHRVSLAVALVLRFIPYLLVSWRERDEAYRARTGKRGGIKIIAPFIVETMHLADRVAETLDARGFGINTDKNRGIGS